MQVYQQWRGGPGYIDIAALNPLRTRSNILPADRKTTVQPASLGKQREADNYRHKLPPLTSFQEIVRRPVFSPERRPPTQASPEVVEPLKPLGLKLIGIVLQTNRQIAILEPQTRPKESLSLSNGAIYQGWQLTEIGAKFVVFTRDGKHKRLQLRFDQAPKAIKRKMPRRPRPRIRKKKNN